MEGRYGVPTAPMVTARFSDYITKDAEAHGMPLRFSYPPHPVGWMPRETLHKYVEGDDPITGRPLMQELVDALTRPLTEQEKNTAPIKKAKRPRLLKPDPGATLNRLFLQSGWTDGLPVVLPTE